MNNKRKSNTLKDLQGTLRPDRLSTNTLKGEILEFLPAPSRRLAGYAKVTWNRVGLFLIKHRILCDLDLVSLEQFAILSNELRKASDELRKFSNPQILSSVNKGGHAYDQVNPRLKLYQSLLRDWVFFAEKFGLTPLSRSKITLPEQAGKQLNILDFLNDQPND